MKHTHQFRLRLTEGRLIHKDGGVESQPEPRDYNVYHYENGERTDPNKNTDPTLAQREAVLSREEELKSLINDTKTMIEGYFGEDFFERPEGTGRKFAGYEELLIYDNEIDASESPGTQLKMQFNTMIRHLDRIQNPNASGEHYDAAFKYAQLKGEYLSILQSSMQEIKQEKSQDLLVRSKTNLDEAIDALSLAATDYKEDAREGRNFEALIAALDKAQERITFEEDLIRLLKIQDQGLVERLGKLRTLRDSVRNDASQPLFEQSEGALKGYNIFNNRSIEQARSITARERWFGGMRGPAALNDNDAAYAAAMENLGLNQSNTSLARRKEFTDRMHTLWDRDEMLTKLPEKRDEGMEIVRGIGESAQSLVEAQRQGRQEFSAEQKEKLFADGRTLRSAEAFFKKHNATGQEPEMQQLYRALAALKEVNVLTGAEEFMDRIQPILQSISKVGNPSSLANVSRDEMADLVRAARAQSGPLETKRAEVERLPDSPHKEALAQSMQSASDALQNYELAAGTLVPLPTDGEIVTLPDDYPYDHPEQNNGELFSRVEPNVNPNDVAINPPNVFDFPELGDPVRPSNREQIVKPIEPQKPHVDFDRPDADGLYTQIDPFADADSGDWPEGGKGTQEQYARKAPKAPRSSERAPASRRPEQALPLPSTTTLGAPIISGVAGRILSKILSKWFKSDKK